MNRFIHRSLVAAAVLALAACSSGVKLNDVPVEDRGGSSVATGGGANSGAAGGGSSQVKPLDVSSNTNQAPGANAARIVYFDFDSYTIRPEFQAAIDTHARYLLQNKASKVAIEGHTDEVGGREYNLALGQRRAEAVRRALGLLGVNEAQIEAVSFGKEKPAATGTGDAAMAKNRRAEIVYR